MSDWKTRLAAERDELANKLDKLTTFLMSDNTRTLSVDDITLLCTQQRIMMDYVGVLNARCARAGL